jgi:choline dehydrogenase-like flavoprotein
VIVDARQMPDGSRLSARLCIIGGGMAGIAIARELRDAGVEILILESGGEAPAAETQALYNGKGTLTDPDGRTRDMTQYLPSSRVRAFGGSGHVWGGKCGRLDPTDFEARDWIPGSGWPFDRRTLDPFYERASKHLELPSFLGDLVGGDSARPAFTVGDGTTFETVPRFHSRVSGSHSREKFDAYRYSVANAPGITVCLHANVTQVEVTPDGRAVSGLEVRTLDGKRHHARADHYILATGGMENARLLLLSNATATSGVGNDRGLVGRYFGGHMNAAADGGANGATSGVLFAEVKQSLDLYTTDDIRKVWGIWNATPQAQHRLRLPNVWVAFTPRSYQATSSEQAVLTLARSVRSTRPSSDGEFVPARIMAEQPLEASSRLTLDEASRDALGQPRLSLDWRLNETYLRGMERCVAALAQTLGASGVGRLRWPLTRETLLPQLNPARHHLGTTRMHTDRAKGVVDEHCRVHGVANLHIAGSSVFPTPGIVNPTLTIIALAVRLADRLRPELRRAG